MKTLPHLAAGLVLTIVAATPAAAQIASTGDGIFGNFYGTERNVETNDRTPPRPLAYQTEPKTDATLPPETGSPVKAAGPWTPPWKRANDKIAR